MQLIEIRNRWNNTVIFSVEAENLREAVEKAVLSSADLYGADLRSAYLSSADLYGADLRSADLRSADLRSADLSSADLSSADLSSADLYGADLRSADLSSADLSSADLSSADLSSANLYGANLYGANLYGANLYGALNAPSGLLEPYRKDIRAVLDTAPQEVGGLLQALWDGKVDGSTYTGDCACLVGTLEKVHGGPIENLGHNSSRPAEEWFMNIRKGDRPTTNPSAAFVCAVIAEWMHENKINAPVTLNNNEAQ